MARTYTYDEQRQIIAERCRLQRFRLDLTQIEVADKLGKGRNWVWGVERKKREIELLDLHRLADALHTTDAYLLGYTDDPKQPASLSDGGAIPGYLDVDTFLVPS